MNCLNCQKELTGKKTYCDDKCRMAYTRRTKMGALPEQKEPEHTTRTFDFSLTRTDQLFEDKKPGYYNFGVKVFERGCFLPGCDKKFKTHLKLLKYCSPKHYVDGLDLIINSITKEKK